MNAECGICKDYYKNDDNLSSLQCGHVFHKNCLGSWLNLNSSCPQCRKHATSDTTIELFIDFCNKEDVDVLKERKETLVKKLKSNRGEIWKFKKETAKFVAKSRQVQGVAKMLSGEAKKMSSDYKEKAREIRIVAKAAAAVTKAMAAHVKAHDAETKAMAKAAAVMAKTMGVNRKAYAAEAKAKAAKAKMEAANDYIREVFKL